MANFLKIELEITTKQPADNAFLALGVENEGDISLIEEKRVNVRSTIIEWTVGTAADTTEDAFNLDSALTLDYVNGGVELLPITVTQVANIVTIEFTEYGWTYDAGESNIPSGISETITPEVEPTPVFAIDEITVQEADGVDKCTNVRYDFTVKNDIPSDFPVQINSPVSKSCPTAGDLFFDYARYPVPAVTLEIESDNAVVDSEPLPRVASFTIDEVTVVEAFAGATVTISIDINTAPFGIDLTYSIDDVSYQGSNVFYGIAAGSYTAYVLDSYGCKKTAPFTVIGVTVDKPEPIFTISNANSFKFYEETTFSPCGNIPNFNNAPVYLQKYFNTEPRNYFQYVQNCDAITTQIRTNYETIEIDVVDCDGNVVQEPPATEERTYTNQVEKRDCKLIDGGSGKTHVYFPGGNIYIPDTSTIDGTYTNPSLNLPSFADDGTIASGIKITLADNSEVNGTFEVEGKAFNEEINGWAFVITANYTNPLSVEATCQSSYNAEDWNTWEFTVDWSILDEGIYGIKIDGSDTDPRYDPVVWYAEPITLKTEHEKSVYITYAHFKNISLIDYSTLLINRLRVPARYIKHRDGGESDNFTSDEGFKIHLRGTVTNEILLETDLIPQYLKQKLSIASEHSELTIEGEAAVLVEKGEQDDFMDEQNRFYKYSAWYQTGDSLEVANSKDLGLTTQETVIGAGGALVLGT